MHTDENLMKKAPQPSTTGMKFPWYAILVIMFGLVIRAWAGYQTHIINPDGILYIFQAKAIYAGQWDDVSQCGLPFLSNYPFFIALLYPLFSDWEFTARLISILFGAGVSVPLFLMLKRFMDQRTAAAATLIYACTPLFVGRSADVIRDPIAWFFLALGIYFFIRHYEKRPGLHLILGCACYIMAAWARIEMGLMIPVTLAGMIVDGTGQYLRRSGAFLMPIIPVFIIGVVACLGSTGNNILFARIQEIVENISSPFLNYRELSLQLDNITQQQDNTFSRLFLPEAENNIWLVAIGTTVNRSLEAFFYPYFVLYLIGLTKLRQRFAVTPRIRLFFIAAVAGLIILYLQLLSVWILEYRYFAIVILPSMVFAGFGVEQINQWVFNRWKLKSATSLLLLSLLVVALSMPFNLESRGENKSIFKNISEAILNKAEAVKAISVAGIASSPAVEWTSFYANNNLPSIICPRQTWALPAKPQKMEATWLEILSIKQVDYLLYERDRWPDWHLEIEAAKQSGAVVLIETWRQDDVGRLDLYRIRKAK